MTVRGINVAGWFAFRESREEEKQSSFGVMCGPWSFLVDTEILPPTASLEGALKVLL
jgi:hypothetical protein